MTGELHHKWFPSSGPPSRLREAQLVLISTASLIFLCRVFSASISRITFPLSGVMEWLAWENSRHLATPPLVSPPNDVWETSAEIPYWWRVTSQIWVELLIGRARRKFISTNQKHYPDLGSNASSVWNFCTRFSDVISRGKQWWSREMSAVFRQAIIDLMSSNFHALQTFIIKEIPFGTL